MKFCCVLALVACCCGICAAAEVQRRIPIIDVTDLYHPYQDPGDNFDLIAAYALPEVELRAVVFDVTDEYRKPVGQIPGLPKDDQGPRDPGFVQVAQLNRIFNRDVPCACAPFKQMKLTTDKMLDAPSFEQAGIELLLKTLRETTEPLEILSFGSARPVAVAYNREPGLFASKVRRVHLSAGSADPGFFEWNTVLDPKGIVRVLRSDLRVAIYPCGAKEGGFAYSPGNTYWRLPNLHFVQYMDPQLRRYAAYSFERSDRRDFLRALEDDGGIEMTSRTLNRSANVWETALWMEVTGRKLVRHADGHPELVAADEVTSTDTVLPGELRACTVDVQRNGDYTLHSTTATSTTKWMYYRGDPKANEAALQEAFPRWYQGIRPGAR
jgi:hypothetical protein